jgi:hypothetical protein
MNETASDNGPLGKPNQVPTQRTEKLSNFANQIIESQIFIKCLIVAIESGKIKAGVEPVNLLNFYSYFLKKKEGSALQKIKLITNVISRDIDAIEKLRLLIQLRKCFEVEYRSYDAAKQIKTDTRSQYQEQYGLDSRTASWQNRAGV